jgi:alanine racemase
MEQLELFKRALVLLEQQGLRPRLAHSACSAAALLFDDTHFNMARIGISSYGLYSSKETLVSVRQSGREPMPLQPVMTWKTRIAQVKRIEANQSIGYGRSYKTTRVTDLAVLPVGYANGYDRGLSNKAHVLVRGQRAKVLGRVMMNMIVVDVTDIAGSTAGDEVVLLGLQGNENISAELMASWLDTINYEVVTRIEPFGPRFVVDK